MSICIRGLELTVIRTLVQAAIVREGLPNDEELGSEFDIYPRLIREIHGLSRPEMEGR